MVYLLTHSHYPLKAFLTDLKSGFDIYVVAVQETKSFVTWSPQKWLVITHLVSNLARQLIGLT